MYLYKPVSCIKVLLLYIFNFLCLDYFHWTANFCNVSSKDLTEIEWEGVEWIHVIECRGHWPTLVKMVMNIRGQ